MQTDWTAIGKTFGYPTMILFGAVAVVGLLLKKLWPYIQRYLERAEKQSERVQEILTGQLDKAERAVEKVERVQETLLKDFRGAIEENNRVSRKVAESLDELLRRTKS